MIYKDLLRISDDPVLREQRVLELAERWGLRRGDIERIDRELATTNRGIPVEARAEIDALRIVKREEVSEDCARALQGLDDYEDSLVCELEAGNKWYDVTESETEGNSESVTTRRVRIQAELERVRKERMELQLKYAQVIEKYIGPLATDVTRENTNRFVLDVSDKFLSVFDRMKPKEVEVDVEYEVQQDGVPVDDD